MAYHGYKWSKGSSKHYYHYKTKFDQVQGRKIPNIYTKNPKLLLYETKRKKKPDYSSFTAHLWTDWKGMLQCFSRHRKDPKMIERLKNDFTIGMKAHNTDFSNGGMNCRLVSL